MRLRQRYIIHSTAFELGDELKQRLPTPHERINPEDARVGLVLVKITIGNPNRRFKGQRRREGGRLEQHGSISERCKFN